jgi:GAF domain-containing protein/CheY-like chemotaxis protein
MSWLYALLMLNLFLSIALAASVAFYAWRRRQTPGTMAFATLMVAVAAWSFAYALEINSPAGQSQLFWFKVKYFSTCIIPVALLVFSLQFTGKGSRANRRTLALLTIEPLIISGLILTSESNDLFWRSFGQLEFGSFTLLEANPGPIFWVHAAYSYSLVSAGFFLLLQTLSRGKSLWKSTSRRARLAVLAIGVGVPLSSNILSIFKVGPFRYFDPTPFVFTITGLAIQWGILRFRFLEILPLAQRAIMEVMQDGLVVLDLQDRIIYSNPAASLIFRQPASQLVRQPIHQILAGRLTPGQLAPPWLNQPPSADSQTLADLADEERPANIEPPADKEPPDQTSFEICLGEGQNRRYYDLRILPLKDSGEILAGKVVIWHDVTDTRQSEHALRRQLEERTVLHALATACVEANQEDILIERVTRIIAQMFHGDSHTGLAADLVAGITDNPVANFGIWLFDEVGGGLRCHASSQGVPPEARELLIGPGQGNIGQVFATGTALYVPDQNDNPAHQSLDPLARSQLSLPIKTGEQVIGIIHVESRQPDAFSQADQRLLITFALQLAIAIERLRAEAAERQRVQELQAITRVSREITSVLDQQQVLDSIVRHAAEISNTGASGLFAYRPDGRFYLVAAYGVSQDFIDIISSQGTPMEGTAVGRAVSSRQPYQIYDIEADPGYATPQLADMEKIHSILALPLLRGEEVLGGIVIWDHRPRRFTPAEEVFLQALANQSINAVQNARLFEMEREQRKMAEVLRETGSALSATLDFNQVLERLLDQLARLVPYDAADLMLVENGQASIALMRGYEQFGEPLFQIVSNLKLEVQNTANLRSMFETKNPLVIPDIRTYPEWVSIDEAYPFRSWAGAPVLIQDRVIAFFSLIKVEANYYRPEHAGQLAIFAGQAGLALQNARLFEETQRRLREVTLLSKVITTTASATDLITALDAICSEVAHFFEAEQAAFALLEPTNGTSTAAESTETAVVVAEYMTPGRPSALGVHIPLANNPSMAYILEHKIPLAVVDAQTDPLLAPVHEIMRQRGVISILLVPLLLGDEVAGTLGIDILHRREFSQAEIELMQNIAIQVSQALDRLNLFSITRQQAERMAHLATLSAELNRTFTFEEVIRNIGQGAMALAQADRAAVYIRAPGDTAYCPWYQGLSAQYVTQVTEQIQETPGGQLMYQTDPALFADAASLPEAAPLRQYSQAENIRGLGLWPLVYEGIVIAVVGLYYNLPHPWLETQQEILLAFTRQAAIALQNTRLFDETRRRAVQQAALNDIIATAVSAPNLTELLEIVLDLSLHALKLEKGGIWITGQEMPSTVVVQGLPEDIASTSLQFTRATGRRRNIPKTLIIRDWEKVKDEDPLAAWKAHLAQYEVRASLIVPVMTGGRRIGVLSLASTLPKEWLPEEIALIETVGRQLGSAAERLDLMQKTREQAQQVQQIIDTVPEGVLLLDSNKNIILANPAARQYLSFLAPEIDILPLALASAGEPPNPVPPIPLTRLAGQPLGAWLQTGPGEAWHELKTEPEGVLGIHPLTFEIAVRPLEAGAQPEGWVLVLRDVTLERENQSQIQMQERLATVGQLAAGIAHDFNNIMAAIVVYADLLALEPNLTGRSRERLVTIQKQIQRATSLIRQILDFSRRAVMEQTDLDLLPFIKELDKLLGRVLPESIRLELAYLPGVYMVKADPTRLQQAFMNLALNARDAMLSGGVLHFDLEKYILMPDEYPPFPDLTPGDWIRIQISDTGIGIPPEIVPRIFDPFFTTKPVGQGTGLGLAQVYGIIKQHGGSIDVHSKVGEGTTFIIYLPALEVPQEKIPESLTLAGPAGAGETVLIVEDDQAAREALQALLENRSYHVLTAANGAEALQIYELTPVSIDLVITDIVMPEMGGVALYQALQYKHPEAKVLFITGHPLDVQSQVLLETRQVHWLQKPFSAQEFSTVIQQILNPAP